MSKSLAVWRPNLSNQWGLYKHTDYKIPPTPVEETDPKKAKAKPKTAADALFYFSKLRQEIKGTLICTPKGYGVIQSIDQVKGIISVKIQGVVYDFEKNDIMSEVPIQVVFLKESTKMEETVFLPVHSTLKELFERVESSIQTTDGLVDVKLFYQGKELEKTDDTLEKLRIAPLSKFLATYMPGKPLILKRFTSSQAGWCVGGSGIDGISFQTTKAIRVIGFGIYPSTNDCTLPGTAKLFQGETTSSTMLWSGEVTMTKCEDPNDHKAIRIMFDKPYLLKASEAFSVTVAFNGNGNCYYGSGGLNKVEGEGEVSFSFKNCSGASNGTGPSSGQIPEIYYYA